VNAIIWVLAYTTTSEDSLTGYLKDPEFLFENQAEAHLKKQEAFNILYHKGLISKLEQVRAVPLNELDIKEV